ncbi:MAG: hypothetical protein E7022_04305 [Desulfovibrio desulfuricans]|nr:hypothetical protein [Desulfovibrio desulfuricans]
MSSDSIQQEAFSISFNGPAFDGHDIPAAALAQSLLALDGLSRRAAETAYGKSAAIDVKVKAGFRPGSFLIDLIIEHPAETVCVGAGAVTILTGVIGLARWAFGKKVSVQQPAQDGAHVTVKNEAGATCVVLQGVVGMYASSRTQTQLSRLTQTLDMEGAESITVKGSSENNETQEIPRNDRKFFKQEEGLVITDNEREVLLEVVGAMLNGSPVGWRFAESDDSDTSLEFSANVEDENFLAEVKSGQHNFASGTTMLVTLRTVQRKVVRTHTERTVVEVKTVYTPEAVQKG